METMNELALFAGAGGGILGGRLLGWRTVCAVERDPYAAAVLAARQNDGSLHPFPIWDDVCTFDGRPWRGRVDVISGGFPCQDISVAGRGTGISGERSGLWREFARIIREVGPRYVFVENSPALTLRGLDAVLGDLAALGYDAEWGVFGADEAALATHSGEIPLIHNRDRIWIVGQRAITDANCVRQLQPQGRVSDVRRRTGDVDQAAAADAIGEQHENGPPTERGPGAAELLGNADGPGQREQRRAIANESEQSAAECAGWWESEPDVDRVVNGLANRVDRLRAIGNGQVPAVAALAWRTLSGEVTP